jgi:hypothetical protein
VASKPSKGANSALSELARSVNEIVSSSCVLRRSHQTCPPSEEDRSAGHRRGDVDRILQSAWRRTSWTCMLAFTQGRIERCRRAGIPKADGRQRPLGITARGLRCNCPASARLSHYLLVGRRKLTSSGWRGKNVSADGRGGPARVSGCSPQGAVGPGRAGEGRTPGGRCRLGNPGRLEGLVDVPPLAAHGPRNLRGS